MKLSTKIIKAMAIEDMHYWIMKFTNRRNLTKRYNEETQEIYDNYIKKMQEKIIKEL